MDASEQVLAQAAGSEQVLLRTSEDLPSDRMFFVEVSNCRVADDVGYFAVNNIRFSMADLAPEITNERVLYVIVHPVLERAGRHMVEVLEEHARCARVEENLE